MDYYYNFETYDISRPADQYKGKTIEGLFPNHTIVRNKLGQFSKGGDATCLIPQT